MPLFNMTTLLNDAKYNNYTIGAFNVSNMEMIMGAIKAAEELNSPIILQIAEVRLKYSPLDLIGPLMVEAAKNSKVPIAVHFDHGTTKKNILKALKIGFSSIMLDASEYPLEENIRLTTDIIEIANLYNASVESELGTIGGSEDNSVENEILYTKISDAIYFSDKTKINNLAIAIGNAHGNYKVQPHLNLQLLDEINKKLPNVNLVLHGGSGLNEATFKTLCALGIKKINIASSSFNTVFDNIKNDILFGTIDNYFSLSENIVNSTYQNVKKHILIFGSQNKAKNFTSE